MKIDILTLFPNMFDGVFEESIIKRAIDTNKVEINLISFFHERILSPLERSSIQPGIKLAPRNSK